MKSNRLTIMALLAFVLAGLSGCNTGPSPRMIGEKASDFTVRDSDRTVSLHDYRGKVVILNFWATWCVPCVEEMPSLVRLQKEMGPKVTVLAISIDENEAAYHRFLRQYNIDLITVRDPAQKASEIYGTTGWPETFIIDASGTIRRKFIGAFNWTSPEIIDYLNKLQS